MDDSFKLLIASLGLSVKGAADLFGLPDHTMQGYAHKERPVPASIMDRAREYFAKVDSEARTFLHAPERVAVAGMVPTVLRGAVYRRIQEINIVEAGRKK